MYIGRVVSMATSTDGYLVATAGEDKALKIFDVINFGSSVWFSSCLIYMTLTLVFISMQINLYFHPTPLIIDMINMFRLSYQPSLCEWIYSGGAAMQAIAW